MASAPTKRQQARNERTIQDLVRSVPGNDRCADCLAKNPGWASWSLGIFLCMRCAALHRKLGTHISKVKSLSMDTWTNEQVEGMKRVGNAASNRRYNPHNVKPSIPLDVDEVDAAMERFIRQKYEQQSLQRPKAAKQNTGSTSSEEPPPLPPKPAKHFGMGARSATAGISTDGARRGAGLRSPSPDRLGNNGSSSPSTLRNKPSRVFGASIGASGDDSLEPKLATLRDMGFSDDQRNQSVLKGLNGNLDRSIEALVRLGDGAATRNVATTATNNTNPPQSADMGNNPFQRRATEPDLALFSHASTPMTAPVSYNPFHPVSTQPSTPSLEQSFQMLQVTQPLFPNATGGFPAQHHNHHQHPPQLPNPGPTQVLGSHLHAQQQYTPNPSASNPFPVNPATSSNAYNPFYAQQSAPPTQTSFGASDLGSQAQYHGTPLGMPSQPSQTLYGPPSNPYTSQQQPPSSYSQPQPVVRADKSTIMALYNYPQLAPMPSAAQNSVEAAAPAMHGTPATQVNHRDAEVASQRSVSSPVGTTAGSRNPFLQDAGGAQRQTNAVSATTSANAATSAVPYGIRHGSQESVDLGGWQNGRHSPDAFASLSARSGR